MSLGDTMLGWGWGWVVSVGVDDDGGGGVNTSSSSSSTTLGLSLVKGVQGGGTYLIAMMKVVGVVTLVFVDDGG